MKKLTEEQKQFAQENHNIIYQFLIKYSLPIYEYYDIAAIGFCKAVATYSQNKSAFSTYAYFIMYNEVKYYWRSKSATKQIDESLIYSYDSEFDLKDNSIPFLETITDIKQNTESNAICNVFVKEYIEKIKNPLDIKILALLSEGYTQLEISNLLSISQPKVSRVRKKFLNNYLYEES